MSSPFKRLKGITYVDTIVDVPFAISGNAKNCEIVLQVRTFAPGLTLELTRITLDNLHKRGVNALPGSMVFTLENCRLRFDRLKEHVVGWIHNPPVEDEKPTPFSKEALSDLLSEDFTDFQKMFVINEYDDAYKKAVEKAKTEQESGNEPSGVAS